MNDISGKITSLRTARGEAQVSCSAATIARIQAGDLPKGNFFDTARAAGLLAAKQTQHLLPHCHPVPIDGFQIDFEIQPAGDFSNTTETTDSAFGDARGWVRIVAEGRSVSRTGIEMEVLTALSVTALTMYDMLKPVDAQLEIGGIRLLGKTGGRTQQRANQPAGLRAAVLVASDRAATGETEDRSGPLAAEMLRARDVIVEEIRVVPDEADAIRGALQGWLDAGLDFIFTSGGTGLGPRDRTVDVVRELIQKDAPGIAEAMRSFGQDRTAFAMLSRSVAGSAGRSLIVTLPGSPGGVRESLQAILPGVLHARAMLAGDGH
ncbi:MAG: bifunctional molybdenum cofactor biosynthesis protein MoaC/MoaB [bacterium]|nr:bifunctional molybdenum cofactor biosynthesis protein MoaC/MoaB [bacterium]